MQRKNKKQKDTSIEIFSVQDLSKKRNLPPIKKQLWVIKLWQNVGEDTFVVDRQISLRLIDLVWKLVCVCVRMHACVWILKKIPPLNLL